MIAYRQNSFAVVISSSRSGSTPYSAGLNMQVAASSHKSSEFRYWPQFVDEDIFLQVFGCARTRGVNVQPILLLQLRADDCSVGSTALHTASSHEVANSLQLQIGSIPGSAGVYRHPPTRSNRSSVWFKQRARESSSSSGSKLTYGHPSTQFDCSTSTAP